MDRSPRGRNLRKGRVSEVNRIYLVTAVTRKRLPIFGDLPSAGTPWGRTKLTH